MSTVPPKSGPQAGPQATPQGASSRQSRLAARAPKGLKDTLGADVARLAAMTATIRNVYERFGFAPLETSALEYVEVLGKFLPESDQPDAGIFALKDADEQWIALRYDLTAPLSRFVAENSQSLPMPFRRYQLGPVWRNEKPGPGRFREFLQFDADTVGSSSMVADAENAALLARAFDALGLVGQYRIAMNNRKILDGLLEKIGLGSAQGDPKAMTVMRAVDKFDKFGDAGVRLLLTTGRKDESGDFTKGAGLADDEATRILDFMHAGKATRKETLAALEPLVAGSARGEEGVRELAEIDAILAAYGLADSQAAFDPGIVRGLAYYTGPVIEAQATFEIIDEKGHKRQFGSIAGGGRYDGLVGRFMAKDMPATGVSIGVDRLFAALTAAGKIAATAHDGPVLVTVFDKAHLPDYVRMAEELRSVGIAAEVYAGDSGMKAQLKYADRRRSPLAIIAGSDEFARGEVSIKDLAEGERLAASTAGNAEWRDKSRAQTTVPRVDLVAHVRAALRASLRASPDKAH